MRGSSGLAPLRGAAVARHEIEAQVQLAILLRDLEAALGGLAAVDPDPLDDLTHDHWADGMDALELAESRARGALRSGVPYPLAQALPSLRPAIGALADDLTRLSDAAARIAAVRTQLPALRRVIVLGL